MSGVCLLSPHGFQRGLTAEEILGAGFRPGGQLCFLVKWRGSSKPDLVLAAEANVKIPQIIIQFYQARLRFEELQINTGKEK